MSVALKTKLRTFLEERQTLQLHYLRLKDSAQDLGPNWREALNDLYEFDQLCYIYKAIKTYYDVSKSSWNPSDRKPLEEFTELMPKIEARLAINDLCGKFTGLQVLRRNLQANAESGGRVAHAMMISSTNPGEILKVVDGLMLEIELSAAGENASSSLREWATISTKPVKKKGPARQVKPRISPSSSEAVSTKHNSRHEANSVQAAETVSAKSVNIAEGGDSQETDSRPAPYIQTSLPASKQGFANALDASGQTHTKLTQTEGSVDGTGSLGTASGKTNDISSNGERSPVGTHIIHLQISAPEKEVKPSNATKRKISVLETDKTEVSSFATHVSSERQKNESEPDSLSHTTRKKIRVASEDETNHSRTLSGASSKQLQAPSRMITPIPVGPLEPGHAESPKSNPSVLAQNDASAKHKNTGSNMGVGSQDSDQRSSFAQFLTWNKENVRCIVNAAAHNVTAPAMAIQQALFEKYNIAIRLDEAESLRLHYGLTQTLTENYDYCIQTFRLVAAEFKEKGSHYVTPPWRDIQTLFFRKSQKWLLDWDVKGRYHLFLLHYRVFGKGGEPPSNYRELVESYRKKFNLQSRSKNKDGSSFFSKSPQTQDQNHSTLTRINGLRVTQDSSSYQKTASSQITQPGSTNSEGASPKVSTSRSNELDHSGALKAQAYQKIEERVNTKKPTSADASESSNSQNRSLNVGSHTWTSEAFQALVNGYCLIPRDTPNRAIALIQYIRFKTNEIYSLDQLLTKTRTHKFLKDVQLRMPYETAESIAKLQDCGPQMLNLRGLASVDLEFTLSKMKAEAYSDIYYRARLRKEHLTAFWDYSKTKCIMSTIEYADRIPSDTKVAYFKVIRTNVFKYIRVRLLREHGAQVDEETVKARLVRMMELDMFNESQCRLINEVFHNS